VAKDPYVRRPDVMNALQKPVVFRFRVIELDGNRILRNEIDDFSLRIRHGIQRLASTSTRIEDVQHNEFALRSRLFQRGVEIVLPRNGCHSLHVFLRMLSALSTIAQNGRR
jgi:hypothetical protein